MEKRAMKNTTDVLPDPLPDTFNELNTVHQLRPIRDKVDYDNAAAMIDRLVVMDSPTQDQEDYLGTLTELIGKYDDDHYVLNLDHLSPVDSLKFLMEQNGMSAYHLGKLLNIDISSVSEILKGNHELEKAQIGLLSDRFNVNPCLFF